MKSKDFILYLVLILKKEKKGEKKEKKSWQEGEIRAILSERLTESKTGSQEKGKKFLTNGSESVKIKKNRESGEETKRVEKASEVVYLVN